MIIAKIQVNGAIAKTVYRKAIPAGIIGAQVEFDYADDIWHGLRKTVVFKGAVTKDVVTDANIVTIPHEVVEKPSFRLNIGVYGVDADGNVAIPTLWEDIGAILDAADPSGDTNTDPSLPVWAQIQEKIGNLDELTTESKSNLVAAINEAKKSGGGESVQPDWNQNDDTQPDYVKNRPFYTGDPVETVLVEETTAPFSEGNGLYVAEVPSTFEATVGETYKVSWDGADYECACVAMDGTPLLLIGNMSIFGAGSDTGEPFVIIVYPNGNGMGIGTANTSASHTFSIGKTVAPVVKIDKKYLVQPDWNQNDENAADFVKNRPFYVNSLVSVRNPGNSKAFWYKVSDDVPTGEHSVGAPCSIVVEGERTNREIILSTDDYYAATEGSVVVVLKDNVKIEEITFPKKGTYFAYRSSVSFVSGFALGADADSEITWDGRTEKELKKIDEKYLPDTLATKSEVEAAQTAANSAKTTAEGAHYTANHADYTANNAQTTANNAQTTAKTARTTANNALSAANSAKTTAEGAQTTANNALSAANDVKNKVEQALTVDSSGSISAPIHGMSSGTYQIMRLSSADGYHQSSFATSGSAGLRIFVCRDGGLGGPQSNVSNPSTVEFVPSGASRVHLKGIDELIMNSATTGSKKKFKITVDDSGTFTAVEVV